MINKSIKACTLVAAAAFCLPLMAQQSSSEEVIEIKGNEQTKAFPHFWEQALGSERAVVTLRESYRDDLRMTKKALDLKYIRFHAIFHDEMGVYDEDKSGNAVYNFSYVDQVYDGLLQNGVKPFVEIGFMPRKLAKNLEPHPFWYKQLPSPPKDHAKWVALVDAFTKHLIERYGKEEVESWYFEVWNEPNIDFWNGDPKESTYYELYDETARAVKKVDQKIRIGGPVCAQAAWVDKFIEHCVSNKVLFDFVSSHIYGNEDPQLVFGNKNPIPRRNMVARSVKKVYDQVKASKAPNTPIIWSEYNATYLTQIQVTDSPFMGPWLANNIRECDGLADMMALWAFSDVFEEQGVVKTPFYGGYGLIAERNIPKPAFRAMEMLHKLGDQRIENKSENALITKRADGKTIIALWNYAEPDEQGAPKQFKLNIAGGSQKYRVQILDEEHGSSLTAWKKQGMPSYPSKAQIEEMVGASELAAPEEHPISDPIKLGPRSLALLELN